jgi:hypothetical protein
VGRPAGARLARGRLGGFAHRWYRARVAFGFPAYHEEVVTFPTPVTHDWVVYACQAGGLGIARWGHGVQGGAWRVSPSTTLFSWGENVVITPLAPNVLRIRSECGLPTQCIDWGKNETNVKKLAHALWAALQNPQPPYR